MQDENQVHKCNPSGYRIIEKTTDYEVIESGEYTFKFLNTEKNGGPDMGQNKTNNDDGSDDDFDILSLDLDERQHTNKEENDTNGAEHHCNLSSVLNGNDLVINLARIHPEKFPFFRVMLEHGPELLPDSESVPTLFEELLCKYILIQIRLSDAPRRETAERFVRKLWEQAGGKSITL